MKKGEADPLKIIIALVILVVVLYFMISFFMAKAGEGAEVTGDQFKKMQDCDCDGVANFIDPTPCGEAMSKKDCIKYIQDKRCECK